MSTLKRDCESFRDIVEQMVSVPGRDPSGVRWPSFLFHLTDVQNAASILRSGVLLSRAAEVQDAMSSDNAHQDIIAQTAHFVRQYVRLYFRPRTPTFFRNEGLRPLNAREDAHCPVPVAFLFDTASVLCLPEAQFSDGSLARRDAVLGRTAKEFSALPFGRIYHDRSLYGYDPVDRDDIIFRRQAEVIIPSQLPLEGLLRYVFARSPADLETLISLIGDSQAPSLMNKGLALRVNTQSPLFFKRWSFVQRVYIASNHLSLVMNADTQTPGPFVARFDFFDQQSERLLSSVTRQL